MNDDNWKEITETPGELWDLPELWDIFDENDIEDVTDDQFALSIQYDY